MKIYIMIMLFVSITVLKAEITFNDVKANTSLSAGNLLIDVNGLSFGNSFGNVGVHGDPGDKKYRTLELTWYENNQEQRIYMYFKANNTHWWLDELRIYNTSEEWVYGFNYDHSISALLGTSYICNNLDMKLYREYSNTVVEGHLYLTNFVLTAFSISKLPIPENGNCCLESNYNQVIITDPTGCVYVNTSNAYINGSSSTTGYITTGEISEIANSSRKISLNSIIIFSLFNFMFIV